MFYSILSEHTQLFYSSHRETGTETETERQRDREAEGQRGRERFELNTGAKIPALGHGTFCW